jgi:hypothetical protein
MNVTYQQHTLPKPMQCSKLKNPRSVLSLAAASLHRPQVGVQRLSRNLGPLEPERPTGFPLMDGCSVYRVTIGCHVVGAESREIALVQLAIDRKVEHCQVARAPL